MQRSFRSFKKNGKECKARSVLFKRTEKNAKNGTFFLKERKRTQRMERSFEKNGCPTLPSKSEKTSNLLEKICCFHHVFYSFPLLFPLLCPRAYCSRGSLQNSDREGFASVTLYKRATMSDLLPSLFTKERRSEKRVNHYFALSLTKNKRFARKNQRANSQPCSFILTVVACRQ